MLVVPSWFKKVFHTDTEKSVPPAEPAQKKVRSAPSLENPALGQPDIAAYDRPPVKRRVINAPIVVPEEEQSSWSEDIRIKAQIQRDRLSCIFMVDRPVLETYSAWFPVRDGASDVSPLADRLFDIDGVGSVLLHGTTVTLTLSESNRRTWEEITKEAGAVIRDYLKSGAPVVTDAFVDSMPPEHEIREGLEQVIQMEINPGIASHSGVITLERVEGNTVYITMGGGCQGCAASTITLKQGIHQAFRQTVPQVGAIFDETDHASGTNPYFKELPAGMA